MRNKELVFGDIVEDVETSIRYCVFKSLTSAKCSKNFLACLEVSSDNNVINHVNKIKGPLWTFFGAAVAALMLAIMIFGISAEA